MVVARHIRGRCENHVDTTKIERAQLARIALVHDRAVVYPRSDERDALWQDLDGDRFATHPDRDDRGCPEPGERVEHAVAWLAELGETALDEVLGEPDVVCRELVGKRGLGQTIDPPGPPPHPEIMLDGSLP